jgi:RNA polymerase sigma factor for flagellar operon FliA
MEPTTVFDEKGWSAEVARPGSSEREAFLLHYAPLVKVVVSRIAARLPRGLEIPDLVGEGILGLIDAVERFDPSRGVPFGVYARQRIRGAVLDHLRAIDPLPRSARDRQDRLRALRGEEGAPQSLEDLARLLGVPAKRLQLAGPAPVLLSLESLEKASMDPVLAKAPAPQAAAPLETNDPLGRLLRHERLELVQRAITALPEKEKLVMSLYYAEELTMKEVGEVLRITESRVCQIHREAIARIRRKLRALLGLPGARQVAALRVGGK